MSDPGKAYTAGFKLVGSQTWTSGEPSRELSGQGLPGEGFSGGSED